MYTFIFIIATIVGKPFLPNLAFFITICIKIKKQYFFFFLSMKF